MILDEQDQYKRDTLSIASFSVDSNDTGYCI